MSQSREVSICQSKQNMSQYHNFREKAFKTAVEIDRETEIYSKKRQEVIQEMDAGFRKRIASLTSEHEQAQDQIELAQKAAIRKLRIWEDDVISDPKMTRQAKIDKIQALRKSFTEAFNPNDDYEQYIREHSIEKLMKAFFGGGMLGGFGGAPLRIGGPEVKVIRYSSDQELQNSNPVARNWNGPMIEEIDD